jgi:hypothetical protein
MFRFTQEPSSGSCPVPACTMICTHRTQAHRFTCCHNIASVHADKHSRTISVVFSQVLDSSLTMVPVWTKTCWSECHNCNSNYFIIWDFILLSTSVGTVKSFELKLILLHVKLTYGLWDHFTPNDPWYMLMEFVPTHCRTQCNICISFILWF